MSKTVVVVCIDGFDPEYLEACETPNLREMSGKGFLKIGRCMMPSVTNVNNVSMVTASYPEDHGICSNYWLARDKGEETYLESGEHIMSETIFQRARRQGKTSTLVTSKDKLRTLLSNGVTTTVSSEQPPGWVVEGIGPAPEIYSLEVNGWAIKAAGYVMTQRPADVVYIATTDYAMHTYRPDHSQSRKHMAIIDNAIGELVEAHPDVTLLVTADHGMSGKTRMIDLKHSLDSHGIRARVVPIIKDRYVVHHSNLGGCVYVHLPPSERDEALKVLRETPGVEDALPCEEAAARLRLHPERIGDIVVTGEVDVVFGDPSEVEMPPNLRTHGSHHELSVPLIGYNGDFAGFSFDENRDMGRYIFERVLS
ncbi:MAG: alkaline phosphatase family protein [Dehalococcoidia bacterium]|nr:alkaline phosphatase family protein [Dehalococcoidia bacterium]